IWPATQELAYHLRKQIVPLAGPLMTENCDDDRPRSRAVSHGPDSAKGRGQGADRVLQQHLEQLGGHRAEGGEIKPRSVLPWQPAGEIAEVRRAWTDPRIG